MPTSILLSLKNLSLPLLLIIGASCTSDSKKADRKSEVDSMKSETSTGYNKTRQNIEDSLLQVLNKIVLKSYQDSMFFSGSSGAKNPVIIGGESIGYYKGSLSSLWHEIADNLCDKPKSNYSLAEYCIELTIGQSLFTSSPLRDSTVLFRHLNPAAILRIANNFVYCNRCVLLGSTTNDLYLNNFSNVFRAVATAHHCLKSELGLRKHAEEYAKAMTQEGFNGVNWLRQKYGVAYHNIYLESPPPFFEAVGFWLRRNLDGSDEVIWNSLMEMMLVYDEEWLIQAVTLEEDADLSTLQAGLVGTWGDVDPAHPGEGDCLIKFNSDGSCHLNESSTEGSRHMWEGSWQYKVSDSTLTLNLQGFIDGVEIKGRNTNQKYKIKKYTTYHTSDKTIEKIKLNPLSPVSGFRVLRGDFWAVGPYR